MPYIDRSYVIKTLIEGGFSVTSVQLGLETELELVPFIIFDHTIYPGVEAHLFTAADASLWMPAFTSSGDVVLYRPNKQAEEQNPSLLKKDRVAAWQDLLVAINKISNLLKVA